MLASLSRGPDGRQRMVDIAGQLCVSKSGVTQITGRLVAAGLAARESSATDRRLVYAAITTAGRDLLDKAAGIYEGVHIGHAEVRGIAVDTPEGPFKLAVIRFNLENGKIGEFALEGLDAKSPKGPVKVGRFALKSFDVANLLRMSADYRMSACGRQAASRLREVRACSRV